MTRSGSSSSPSTDAGGDVASGGPAFFPRPRIVLSRCLEMEACRYNGRMIRSAVVRGLDPWVEWVPVCPEVEVGLGTPRDPIRLVRPGAAGGSGVRSGAASVAGSDAGSGVGSEANHGAAGTRLVQPSTGRDLTEQMHAFRASFLDAIGPVDGFLLKSRSPSCGIDGVKIFAGPDDEEPVDREPGMFAAAVLERFPDVPVEHEARLTVPEVRRRFLTRVFALAEGRRGEGGTGGGASEARALDPPYPPELREM